MQKAIVKSWLPIFPGFYGTFFDLSLDDYTEKTLEDDGLSTAEIQEIYSLECYSQAVKTYELDVINAFIGRIEELLKEKDLITSMTFEKLISPREYNFQNDSVNVMYEISSQNAANIKAYINNNRDAWQKFIYERYNPTSGYMPYYDNDINSDDWNLEHAMYSDHGLGTILEFILGTLHNEDDIITYVVESTSMYLDADAVRNELKAKGFYNTCPECEEKNAMQAVNEIQGAYYVKRECIECGYRDQEEQVSKGQQSFLLCMLRVS